MTRAIRIKDRARIARPGAVVFAVLVTAFVAVLGCAGPFATRLSSPHSAVAPGIRAAWTAAIEGRDAEAAAGFRVNLDRDPGDVFALFGDASLAFERGDVVRAVASYVALIERAAADSRVDVLGLTSLASMAAGRLAVLLDEFGGSDRERRAIEDRVMALPLSRLPWQVRFELAMLADRAARRRGDSGLRSRVARAAGCVRAFTVKSPAGILPHLDLDSVVAEPVAGGREVQTGGCVAAVPVVDGRAGAQRLLAVIEAPNEGSYDVVLDFRGEARLIVDGGVAIHHGREDEYGPRVSASRIALSAGRHQVEIRLATYGGRPDLAMLVVPARGELSAPNAASTADGVYAVSDAARAHAIAAPTVPAGDSAVQSPDPVLVVADLAETYAANRRGQSRRAWQGAARLERLPRFALGLALGATIARDDPSIPANFTRDRARTLLRSALGVDPDLARSRHALATIALEDERPREAIDEARAAAKAAPGWWLPEWTLYAAYRLRGLTWDADQTLDRAIAHGSGACSVIETAVGRAEDRHDVEEEKRLGAALAACGRDSEEQIDRLRRVGDLAGAEAALRRAVAIAPDRDDVKLNLASVLLARGRARAAAALIAATVDPGDGEGQLRLGDALIAAGAGESPDARMVAERAGRDAIAAALATHPEMPEVLRAARALGLPLPLDPFRLDGVKVIRQFEASGRRYAAPAVVVLDRTVTRVFPSGAEMVLNHEIVRVQSKDAIQKWGEISVPERAEILTLRTHKADGTTREPEELAGKDTISAADLAIGDYVEKETIETRAPRDAYLVASGRPAVAGAAKGPRGGFLGDRFYFQSFDAPLDRSEYVLVTTRESADEMHFDRRAGAPDPVRAPAPVLSGHDDHLTAGDTTVTTFAATQVPQLFAERSSVPSIEFVPSVRVSLGVGWAAWTRFLREQLYGTARAAPLLDRAAAEVRALSPSARPEARAAALVAWIGRNIEAEDDLRESASFTVARGRGNRLAVMLALGRALGLDARPVLARSLLTADGQAPTPLEEADDFADPLIRFEFPDHRVFYSDPRLKHAPLGYLPPGLDGARVLILDRGEFELAHSRIDENRAVDMAARLDAEGAGTAEVVETLHGWSALEWAEIVDRFGSDSTKLRQDFEQRWLGVQFPGAVLKNLRIEIFDSVSISAANNVPSSDGITASCPGGPYAAAAARLRYSFSSARFASRRDREIRFHPTFFRSQPGRRYATEPRRATGLLTGFDVPLDLRVRVDLPPGTRLVGPPPSFGSEAKMAGGPLVSGPEGYRFLEDRRIDSPVNAIAPTLVIRRESRLPIMRVSPRDYPALAAALRRVDALEQEEVRIGAGPGRP